MESDIAVALLNQSVEKLGLMFKQYIGDGDSKSYSTVCTSYHYGPTKIIEKEGCILHVTKRMGTHQRKIVCRKNGNFNLRHMLKYEKYVAILSGIVL